MMIKDEIESLFTSTRLTIEERVNAVMEIIIKDRKMIVAPLVKALPSQGSLRPRDINIAINETLKLAGVE